MDFNSLKTKLTNILNDNLEDPFMDTRVGSYFFTDDYEIVFTKYMPKGQIAEDTLDTTDLGFGRPAEKTESYRLNIHYFGKRGDVGSGTSSGLKNRSLVSHYIRKIRDLIIVHSGSFESHILSFDKVDSPVYLRDQQVYVGTLPVIFTKRTKTEQK